MVIAVGQRIQAADALGRVVGQIEGERLRAATDVQDPAAEVRPDKRAEAFRHGVAATLQLSHGKPLIGPRVGVQGFAPGNIRPGRRSSRRAKHSGKAGPGQARRGRAPARRPSICSPSTSRTASRASTWLASPPDLAPCRRCARNELNSARRSSSNWATSCALAKMRSVVTREQGSFSRRNDINGLPTRTRTLPLLSLVKHGDPHRLVEQRAERPAGPFHFNAVLFSQMVMGSA